MIQTPILFQDLPTNFQAHPMKGDITLLTNADAIKRAVRNLVLTDPGEKLFRPYLATGVKESMFENLGPDTDYIMKSKIESIIRNYEPRAELIEVVVNSFPDQNGYNVKIVFSINNLIAPIVLDMVLGRVR